MQANLLKFKIEKPLLMNIQFITEPLALTPQIISFVSDELKSGPVTVKTKSILFVLLDNIQYRNP